MLQLVWGLFVLLLLTGAGAVLASGGRVHAALLPLLRKAAGLILEDSDPDGAGAIAGLSLDIPVIIGASGATRILKSGAVVTMDGLKGTVSCN